MGSESLRSEKLTKTIDIVPIPTQTIKIPRADRSNLGLREGDTPDGRTQLSPTPGHMHPSQLWETFRTGEAYWFPVPGALPFIKSYI